MVPSIKPGLAVPVDQKANPNPKGEKDRNRKWIKPYLVCSLEVSDRNWDGLGPLSLHWNSPQGRGRVGVETLRKLRQIIGFL
ncbi:hypothetical protein SLA2020_185300 [Shorea laevis]